MWEKVTPWGKASPALSSGILAVCKGELCKLGEKGLWTERVTSIW